MPLLVLAGFVFAVFVTNKRGHRDGFISTVNKLLNCLLAIMELFVFACIAMALSGIGKRA
ncbi:hypothetical protein P0D88_32450 [Paraburkholderia sp. RL18-103-BIB-C]|jgi:hypothetical protein|uniref:hypothetical protein n=1 Tax=unclassified Paraburkholderia TaxID=2615204 RepID=UPI0038B75960